jgi:cytoskeletal protein CcmA (bactofilin family)
VVKLKKAVLLLAVFLILIGMVSPAAASEAVSGEVVTVPAGSLKGPLFAAGNNVVINADVDGDVFAAGETVTVNGSITGDLLVAGRTLNINSAVTGDIRCAGSDINFKGQAGQSLTGMGSIFRGMESSRVNRDAVLLGANVESAGTVGGDLLGSAKNMSVSGTVGGDVKLWQVQELKLTPTAVVGGSLTYRSPTEAVVDPGAKINGAKQWEPVAEPPAEKRQEGFNWGGLIWGFAAGVLLWGVLALLFPRMWVRLSQVIESEPWPVLGWGLLVLLLTPLAIILFLITVIGIPISLLLLMIYLALLLASKVIVGDALGRLLSQRFGWFGKVPAILPFMIGFLVLKLLANIPVAGFLVSLVVMCIALGAVVVSIYRWRKPPAAIPPAV